MTIQEVGASAPNPAELHRTEREPLSEAAPRRITPAYDEYVPGEKKAPRPAEPEKAERCTADTGEVDREIERLRDRRRRLEEALRTAQDPAEAEKLNRELARLEQELRQKDTDAYRRQKAEFS